ncbi:MAG TPA: PqiC family protein [Burkholderiales bacterium]|nr:PqiC family protein [Burkholderiales bacterium]
MSARRLGLSLVALALAACASAPVDLVALPPAPAAESLDSGRGTSVLLREVSVPGYLDSFAVVVGREGGSLVVSKNSEWAERPSTGVARVLRDALSQRLEASRVLIAGDGRIADADLTVEFLALDPQHGELHLDARWFYACTAAGGSRGGRTQLDVPLPSATPPAVASATTTALARFAEELVAEIPTECQPIVPHFSRRGR